MRKFLLSESAASLEESEALDLYLRRQLVAVLARLFMIRSLEMRFATTLRALEWTGWRFGDPQAERRRDLLAALRNDDPAQLHLEGEAVGTGRAVVEVPSDRSPPPDGHLAVEVLVHTMEGVVTVHWAHASSGS